MNVIEAVGLRKEFTVVERVGFLRRRRRTVAAVDGVDLAVERGEMLGYIGPNGAGKSTTLKMLTGVLHPSGGEVRVCGCTPVPQRTTLARRIGVVFGQRTQLWWDLPLAESFSLLRHIYRVPESDHAARLARCRRMLELDGFLGTPVRQLSLGQRMRGELTAALLHGPEVLFLDEPTIGLDVVSKHAVRAFLSELGARGDTTVVLTTHDLADIQRLCRRLVVIDHGRVVHDGTLEELHTRYGSRRRVVVDLDQPLAGPGDTSGGPAGVLDLPRVLDLPGVAVEAVEADGLRLTLMLGEPGTPAGRPGIAVSEPGVTAGELVARLAAVASLRDIAIVEPDIEDVVARLYAGPPSP